VNWYIVWATFDPAGEPQVTGGIVRTDRYNVSLPDHVEVAFKVQADDETQALLLVLRHQAVPIRDGRVVQLAPAVDLDAATRRHMDSRIPAAAETHAGKHPGPNKK
jgi:acetyl/propionyl-CoA carboxylase alpha subunit